MPELHTGVFYQDFMSELSLKRDVQRYLEVGVNQGVLMSRIHAHTAVGVDPNFVLNANVAANKKNVHLISATSDRFFSSHDYRSIAGGSPELCFLDGLHTFDYLLRDFMNAEAICTTGSLICMHDCLPLDGIMIERNFSDWAGKTPGTRYENYWTGDVYKIVPILAKYRPDLKVVALDCPPTGVVCVTNLDPKNTYLSDNYLDIVHEFTEQGNTIGEVERLYDNCPISSSQDVLRQFDNTLMFRI